MNPRDVLIHSKISQFKIPFKYQEVAKIAMTCAGIEEGGKYLQFANSLKKTSTFRNIDLDSFIKETKNQSDEVIKKFILRANKSFYKILKPDNKEERNLIFEIKLKNYSLDQYLSLAEKKREYKHLIHKKELNFSNDMKALEEALKKEDTHKNEYFAAIEHQNDEIDKAIIESNANKLKRSILSNKYKHLVNMETESIFLECAKQGIDKEQIRKAVASKIAAMKNPHDFNQLLENVIGLNISWDKEYFYAKAKEMDTEIITEQDNVLYFEINNFTDSQGLGSRMWCITREEEYLDDYLYYENSRIVFRLDLNKDIKDKEAYSALLFKGNELTSVYDKNDSLYTSGDSFFEKQKKESLPAMSEHSKLKKAARYEKLIKNNKYLDFDNLTYLNLLNLNATNLIEYYFKNQDKYYNEIDMGTGIISNKKFCNFLKNFSKEQCQYIMNSPKGIKEKLTERGTETDLVILGHYLETTKDEKMIDYCLELLDKKSIFKEIQQTKKFISLKKINCILNNNNPDIVNYALNKINEKGIEDYKIFSCSTSRDIHEDILKLLEKRNPDFIYNAFKYNPKPAFINLFASDKERTIPFVKHLFKHKVFKEDEINDLKERFYNRLKKLTIEEQRDVDKVVIKAIEGIYKERKNKKIP